MADVPLLATMADADPDAIPVLGDAIILSGWRTSMRAKLVMGLCLGVPLDAVPPEKLSTSEARTRWHQKRNESLDYAASQWDVYAVNGRRDWARAVLAVLLFGAWQTAKRTPLHGSRAPWLLVWRNATADRRAHLAEIQRAQDEYRRSLEQANETYRARAGQ